MNTDYIRIMAQHLIDLANTLDALARGEKVGGLFDQFGAPPIDAENTTAEILRTISVLSREIRPQA